jgi:hypothetical protein
MSQAASIDLNHPVLGPFLLTSQFAATRNTDVSGDQWASHLGIKGQTGAYGAGLFANRIGPDFAVEQGFVPTYSINRQGVSGFAWNKFLQDKSWFKWIDGGASFDVAQEIGESLVLAKTEFWSNLVTLPKWRLGLRGKKGYERYKEREFDNHAVEVQIESNVGGMTGVYSSYSIGTLYDSAVKMLHVGFLFLPIRPISVFPSIQAIQRDNAPWHWLTNTRISYQITHKAFFRIYFQAESGAETEVEQLPDVEDVGDMNANFLFGYEFAPGTLLYLVCNHEQLFDTDITNDILVAKFTYSLRF